MLDYRHMFILGFLVMLAACGGGGGAPSSPPTEPAPVALTWDQGNWDEEDWQ